MNTTQQHVPIADINSDIVILKSGGGALILQVSAVNFGLLSDMEQIAIISSFAQMLNSLSFSIQIVVHSERLNIASYIAALDKAQKAQINPLLSKMIVQYRQFIQSTIKENDVLDKKFYVVVPLFRLELGLTSSKQVLEQKIKTILMPRRDQVLKQLMRVGLNVVQLRNEKLLEVFYDIYNGQFVENIPASTIDPKQLQVKLNEPQIAVIAKPAPAPSTASPPITSLPSQPQAPIQPQVQPIIQTLPKNHPFVVEELPEES